MPFRQRCYILGGGKYYWSCLRQHSAPSFCEIINFIPAFVNLVFPSWGRIIFLWCGISKDKVRGDSFDWTFTSFDGALPNNCNLHYSNWQYLRCPLNRLEIFSRKLFWGAMRPFLVAPMLITEVVLCKVGTWDRVVIVIVRPGNSPTTGLSHSLID